MADNTLNWGIIGTGNIAKKLAAAIRESKTGKLIAVGSRTQKSADTFGEEWDIDRCHPSYDALIADPEVDIIYNSLPNHMHAEWTIKCAQAGKHILCEMPLTTNVAETMALIEACRYHKVFMLEAFMYRCHPQTAKLAELIKAGAIGEVRSIQTVFAYDMGVNLDNIRQQHEAAGGGIMDVGCYAMSMARLIAGAAQGKDFADPIKVTGHAHIGEDSRVDEWAVGSAMFPGDIVASLSCATRCGMGTVARAWGSEGMIEVNNPWFPKPEGNVIRVVKKGQDPEDVTVEADGSLYAIEVDRCAKHIAAGELEASSPAMSWADSLGQSEALDKWRSAVGLTFDREKPDSPALQMPFSNQPLKAREGHNMRYGKVEGVDKPVSRVVMGTMVINDNNMPMACTLLDTFIQRGGTCIDTAYVYGGGHAEKGVGQWLQLRGNREDVVLIGKGAHTPFCNREGINAQLAESLERLQTDYLDIYLLHRDNPELEVGVFVDTLNEHLEAGRIRAFGGSNWSAKRIAEANEYAQKNGLRGFTASSPNFSLALWNEPMWAGCTSASQPEEKAWYKDTQTPLFAWSSQASGFMAGIFSPEDANKPNLSHGMKDVARTWFNDDNWKRLERARTLARDHDLSLVQVTLGYVLNQPLNMFALVGCRTLDELDSSLAALEVELNEDELAWLNLERD